jgi:hypothetical protein
MTAVARWKDLCLDAEDPAATGPFWAAVLGLGGETSTGTHSLVGATPADTVWINLVDRPKRVKNRVHVDVHAVSVAELEGLGAVVLADADDTGFDWTVMAAPEGDELCAFVSRRDPRRGLYAVVVDCVDPVAQARWWADVLGAEVDDSWAPEGWKVEGAGPAPQLVFMGVPEPREGPNRVHWDVVGDADALLAAGATHLWDTDGWRVLADPEGNEFCVFADA